MSGNANTPSQIYTNIKTDWENSTWWEVGRWWWLQIDCFYLSPAEREMRGSKLGVGGWSWVWQRAMIHCSPNSLLLGIWSWTQQLQSHLRAGENTAISDHMPHSLAGQEHSRQFVWWNLRRSALESIQKLRWSIRVEEFSRDPAAEKQNSSGKNLQSIMSATSEIDWQGFESECEGEQEASS